MITSTKPTTTLALWKRRSFQEKTRRVVATTVAALGAALVSIPLLWMLRTALIAPGRVFIQPMVILPVPPRWENFVELVTTVPFWRYTRNTFVIAISCVVGGTISSSLVGFGFARLRSPDKDLLFMLLMSTLMLPAEVVMIPQYILYKKLGWIDTFLPLTVPSFLGGSAFNIFLFRQFFRGIPTELDDSAKIDGAGWLTIYWKLIMPLSKPAVATVAIMVFFVHWNDFMGPLLYLDNSTNWTLSLGLKIFQGSNVYGDPIWHLLMAGALLTMLPPTLIFFFFQKDFVRSVVLTGLKA